MGRVLETDRGGVQENPGESVDVQELKGSQEPNSGHAKEEGAKKKEKNNASLNNAADARSTHFTQPACVTQPLSLAQLNHIRNIRFPHFRSY